MTNQCHVNQMLVNNSVSFFVSFYLISCQLVDSKFYQS